MFMWLFKAMEDDTAAKQNGGHRRIYEAVIVRAWTRKRAWKIVASLYNVKAYNRWEYERVYFRRGRFFFITDY